MAAFQPSKSVRSRFVDELRVDMRAISTATAIGHTAATYKVAPASLQVVPSLPHARALKSAVVAEPQVTIANAMQKIARKEELSTRS